VDSPAFPTVEAPRTNRETVPVPEDLSREVEQYPREFGLPEGLSRGRALAKLLVLGARVARENVREHQRAEVYAALTKDPEYLESAREADAEAFADGHL
jgi:hypothetical protein